MLQHVSEDALGQPCPILIKLIQFWIFNLDAVLFLSSEFAMDSANNTLRERREGVGMEEDPSKQNLLCSSRTRNRVCLPTSPAAPSNVNLFQLRH